MDAYQPTKDVTAPPPVRSKGRKVSVSFVVNDSSSVTVTDGEGNPAVVKMCEELDTETSNVRQSKESTTPPSDPLKIRKQSILMPFAKTEATWTSMFQSVGKDDDIHSHLRHDKVALFLIYMNVVSVAVCIIATLVPMEGDRETVSFTQKVQSMLEEVKPLNSGLFLTTLMFSCAVLVSLYACASTCRRNEAGGLLYRHPCYMPRVLHGLLLPVPFLSLAWGILLGKGEHVWAIVTILCADIACSISLMVAMRTFHQKNNEYPDAVRDREKWTYRIIVINGLTINTTWLSILMLETLGLLLRTEIDEQYHNLISYLFCGLLCVKMVVTSVLELTKFFEWSVYVYGHCALWTTYWLIVSIVCFEEDVIAPLKAISCTLIAVAVIVFAIKTTKTVKYVMDKRKVRSVSVAR